MAQIFALVNLAAGQIDSESATSGQVLTADGAGRSVWADPSSSSGGVSSAVDNGIYVNGSGEPRIHGAYFISGTHNGKTKYEGENGSILWSGSQWEIQREGLSYYTSTDDVETPDLVTTWEVGERHSLTDLQVSISDYPAADGKYVLLQDEYGNIYYDHEVNGFRIHWLRESARWELLASEATLAFTEITDVPPNGSPPVLDAQWTYLGCTVSGAGESGVNQPFFGNISGEYRTADSAFILNIYETRWEIHTSFGTLLYHSIDTPGVPWEVVTWVQDEGALPLPTIAEETDREVSVTSAPEPSTLPLPAIFFEYPEGYIPISDGAGSVSWRSLPVITLPEITFPLSIPVTRDWGTAENAWLDIVDVTGWVPPRDQGEIYGFALTMLLKNDEGWGWLTKTFWDNASWAAGWANWQGKNGERIPTIGSNVLLMGVQAARY